MTPNQLVMLNARPINLNVLQVTSVLFTEDTVTPPHTHTRPRLPKKMRNTHPRNYYDLKGKGIDVHIFFFLSRGIDIVN